MISVALRKNVKKKLGDLFFSKRENAVSLIRQFNRDFYIFSDQELGRKVAIGLYERSEIEFLTKEIRETDICLDIGANIGYFTLLFATRASHVVAFEPIKRNAKLIELTAAVNNIDNIEVRNCLVGDKSESIEFTEAKETCLSGIAGQSQDKYLNDFYAEKTFKRYLIQSVIIDDLVFKKLDIVKIDVEGAEMKVLRGMTQTLLRLRPRLVMIEVVDSAMKIHNDSMQNLLKSMNDLNYKAHILQKNSLIKYSGQIVPNDNLFFVPA